MPPDPNPNPNPNPNNPNPNPGGDPWYQPHVASLDKDTLSWLDGKKFGAVTDALKSGALADKMARDRNVISRPDVTKLDEWDGWEALGYEPDAGKYVTAVKPPKMPNNGQHDAALLDAAAKLGHKLKLPAALTEKFYHGLTDVVNQRLEGIAAAGAKAETDLKAALEKEWGTDAGVNTEIAKRAARTLKIGAEDTSELEKLIGSPRLLKLFHQLGTGALEGKLIDGGGNAPGAMTPAAAEAEVRRLEGDPAWVKIFSDSRHPQNADYKARYMQLMEIIATKGKKAA
jgi:hypothetical protein